MENIVTISGLTSFTITLDPGVWIFDDRKVDLTTYFSEQRTQQDELEQYTKAISAQWDREIIEGAVYPPTLKSEKKFEKEKVLTGSFAIPLRPFLVNAEPKHEAKEIVLVTPNGEHVFSLDEGFELILGFSHEGKPLRDDGPLHAYYGDGRNANEPIRFVTNIVIR